MKCIKVSKDPNKNWKNDAFQFPRLIAEAKQAGTKSLTHFAVAWI